MTQANAETANQDVSEQNERGDVSVSASAKVYEKLRQRIVSFDLPPDTTLSRSDLARQYGVSQTPVREAMQKLDQDGLVNIFPQSRTVVTKIDLPQLYEAHFLRIAVESEIARHLALTPDAELIGGLRSIVEQQRALGLSEAEFGVFDDLDEEFHKSMYVAAGQIGLFHLVKSKSGHLARARRLDLPSEGKANGIMEKHTSILDAIEAGDPNAAQETMRQHLTGTVARIDRLQKENPGFFSAT